MACPTPQAKDRLLRLRQQAREDDAAEFDQRIHEAVDAKERDVRAELAATVAKLTSDLDAMQDAYLQAMKRPGIAATSDLPADADGASPTAAAATDHTNASVLDNITERLHTTLAALEAARAENADLTKALAESADVAQTTAETHAAALDALRAEIADMETQRAAEIADMESSHGQALQDVEEQHAQRCDEMETSMATAMELAQAEVGVARAPLRALGAWPLRPM